MKRKGRAISRYSAAIGTISVALGCLCLAASSAAKPFAVQSTVVGPISASAHPHAVAQGRVEIPFRPFDPAELRAARERVHHQYLNSPQRSAAVGPLSSIFQGLSWSGLAAIPAGDFTPPDGGAGIGPNAFIEAINSEIAVYNRTTTSLLTSSSLATFTGGTCPCDPYVMWDNGAQRWVVISIECTSTSSHTMYLDFTKSTDPTNLSTGWCKYSIDSGSEFPDYPKAGHNSSDWLVGTNDFSTSGAQDFNTAQLWALQKPANGAIASCPALHVDKTSTATQLATVDGRVIFTPDASDQLDSGTPPSGTASDTGYFVAYEQPSGGSASEINVIDFNRDASGTAHFTPEGDIPVTPYTFPGGVPQPGALAGDLLDPSDTRGLGASSHVDPTHCSGCEAVWVEHAVDGSGGRSQIQWDEVNPAACTGAALCGSGARLQDGLLSSPSLFYWNPRISPDGFGNEAVMNFNAGSATQLPQVMAVSNTPADAAGATEDPIVIQTSSSPDDDFSCPSVTGTSNPCRWGDYAAAEADPLNPAVVWNNSMYTASAVDVSTDAQWGTQNFAIRPAGPATDVTMSLTPSSVPANGTAQTVAKAAVADAGGNPVQGDVLTFSSTDSGDQIGPVSDHHDGTYTATITTSTTVGTPTITATDTSVAVSGHGTLTQTPGPATTVGITLSPATTVANGTSQSAATATIADAQGHPIAGDNVSFSSTDSGDRIGPVSDHHDGTYTATITTSTTVGTPTITATDTSAAVSGHGTLTQTPGPATTVGITLSPATTVANGTSQSAATATIADAQGHPIAGDNVSFSSTDSGDRIGPVSDHHDGTYTATITTSTTVGTPTITAADSSVSPPVSGHTTLTQAAPQPVITNLTESHHQFRVGKALASVASGGPASRESDPVATSSIVELVERATLLASELTTFARQPAPPPVATDAAKNKPPVGTMFSFGLSTNAQVRLAFTQTLPGRKVGGNCVAQNQHNRNHAKCGRAVPQGSIGLSAHAGADRVSFAGRVSRTKKLGPGHYTMALTASNSTERSTPRTISFTVVK